MPALETLEAEAEQNVIDKAYMVDHLPADYDEEEADVFAASMKQLARSLNNRTDRDAGQIERLNETDKFSNKFKSITDFFPNPGKTEGIAKAMMDSHNEAVAANSGAKKGLLRVLSEKGPANLVASLANELVDGHRVQKPLDKINLGKLLKTIKANAHRVETARLPTVTLKALEWTYDWDMAPYDAKLQLNEKITALVKAGMPEEGAISMMTHTLPGNHRANLAEVGIKAFKQHFLSILAGTAPDFPWSSWDQILPQALITLNLLRKSHATPSISAHAHLCGHHDYNAKPLLPIGAAAEVHVKSDERKSWDFHSQPGWYLYTSEDHYRTHAFLMKNTRRVRLADTAVLHKQHITNPTISIADKVVHAAAKLAADAGLLAKRGKTDADMNDLKTLAETVQSLADRHSTQLTASVPVPRVPDDSPPTDPVRLPVTRARARELAAAPAPRVPQPAAAAPRVPQPAAAAPRVLQPASPAPRVPATPIQATSPAPSAASEPIAARTRSKATPITDSRH
ncbi:hypothetical protein THAOC_34285, partial [Thalassiosira oceanica]